MLPRLIVDFKFTKTLRLVPLIRKFRNGTGLLLSPVKRLVFILSYWVLKTNQMGELTTKSFRAFIAIPLPDHVRQSLSELQNRLRKTGIRAAWPRPQTFHLTLKFLGEISPDLVPGIQSSLACSEGKFPDIQLSAGSIGVFPGIKRARVIWAGTGGRTDLLEKLFKELESNLISHGFKPEKRRFSPHYTLARIKQPVRPEKLVKLIRDLKDYRSRSFYAETLRLYESQLLSSGAVHKKLYDIRLGKRRT